MSVGVPAAGVFVTVMFEEASHSGSPPFFWMVAPFIGLLKSTRTAPSMVGTPARTAFAPGFSTTTGWLVRFVLS